MIDIAILVQELKSAAIQSGGCNVDGVVWDVDGLTEIQARPDVAAVIAAHVRKMPNKPTTDRHRGKDFNDLSAKEKEELLKAALKILGMLDENDLVK